MPKPASEPTVGFSVAAPEAEGSYQSGFQASSGSIVAEGKGEMVTVTTLPRAGVLSGLVTLRARASSGGAAVTVEGYSATTGTEGGFQVALPPGSYTMAVSAPGYLGCRRDRVSVALNGRTVLPDIALPAGNVVAEVPGSGHPETVDIHDLVAIAAVFNSTPPSNPGADLNADGTVNIFDLAAATSSMGREEPVPWPD